MTMKKMYSKGGNPDSAFGEKSKSRMKKKMLKGGQKKLDLNKNGVLDGGDFRMLGSKKKKMKGGGVYVDPKKKNKMKKPRPSGHPAKGKITKKMMGGQQTMANPPAASFLEQPTAQPFAGDPSVMPSQNPAEFTARKGGVKKKRKGGLLDKDVMALRKKQREERRQDRKADKSAVKSLKKSSKKSRKAKPFKDGAGPIVEMTRSEKREDRRATRKASRTFTKQERKARRQDRKTDRTERKNLRSKNKQEVKDSRSKLVNKKLNTLNQSESSSNKPKAFIGPKNKPNTNNKTVTKKKEVKGKSVDDMTYSQAYRAQRDANKEAGIANYGDDRGYFTYKGKEYNTESASEKKARLSKKSKLKKEAEEILTKFITKDKTSEDKVTKKKTSSSSSSGTTKKSTNLHKEGILRGGYSCFSAGTLITTENGEVAIEDIKVDDMVKTYNEKTKEIEVARVDELFVHEECGDGLILNGNINTTTNHPFYVDSKWVEGKDLKLGDELLNLDGSSQMITSMELNSEEQTVYNFEVPGNHNYYAEGVLVHNKMKRGGYRRRGGKR